VDRRKFFKSLLGLAGVAFFGPQVVKELPPPTKLLLHAEPTSGLGTLPVKSEGMEVIFDDLREAYITVNREHPIEYPMFFKERK
jgi:hypothetical protein